MQGVFAQLDVSGFIAFSTNAVSVYFVLKIFSESLGLKLPFKAYISAMGLGFALSLISFLAKISFELSVLPFCLSCSLPFIHASLFDIKKTKKDVISNGFRVLLFLNGLHFLDFAILRPNENMAVLGFSIALVFYFCYAVYIPAFILNKISLDYTLSLENEVIKQTRQLLESNEQLEIAFLSLKEKNSELETLSTENRTILSVLVHDISTPLQVLFYNAKSLITSVSNPTEEIIKKSLKIEKSITNISQILQEIKTLHAARMGKQTIDVKEVSMDMVMEYITETYSERLNAKNINLEVNIEKGIVVLGNESWLKNQIFANLISNAIKFSFPGGKIKISSQLENSMVKFFVEDQGVGVPHELRGKIFELNASTTNDGTMGEKGTGLGLPIVRQYLQLMGGDIKIVDREAAGACFEIIIRSAHH